MKLSELTLNTEEIRVIHPELGDVGIVITVHNPMSREYNSAVARFMSDKTELPMAVMTAEAATVGVSGIDDFEYTPEAMSAIYRDDRYFWLAFAVYEHIAKKKALFESHLKR